MIIRRFPKLLHLSLYLFSTQSSSLSLKQIQQCRQFFSLQSSPHSDLESSCKQYIQARGSLLKFPPLLESQLVLEKWNTMNPLQCQIDILSSSEGFSKDQNKYLEAILVSWGTFFVKNLRLGISQGQNGKEEADRQALFKKAFKQYFSSLNQLLYLLDMSNGIFILYLKIYQAVARLKLIKHRHSAQLRYIFDYLLQKRAIGEKEMNEVLSLTTFVQVELFYHEKAFDIMSLIFSKVPSDWIHSQEVLCKRLLFSCSRSIFIPSSILREIPLLLSKQAFRHKVLAFSILVQFFVIDKETIQQPLYTNALKELVRQQGHEAFKILSRLFYLADIWIDQFWLPYFSYMGKGQNYSNVYLSNHKIINDLATAQKQSKAIAKAAQIFKGCLQGRGVKFEDIDVQAYLDRIYGKPSEEHSKIQKNMAKTLAVLGNRQISSQISIKYFAVDILVDRRVVVEINNESHYKQIDGELVLNLKSRFRQRVLEGEGYQCLNIRVFDYTGSNYTMLQQIQNILNDISTELGPSH